jgi:purine-cytosine permease-like protein
MPREINNTQPYADKLVKFIPSEIIGIFTAVSSYIGTKVNGTTTYDEIDKWLMISVFFILLILTPFYLYKITKVTNKQQIVVSTILFVIWVYTIGGPFSDGIWNMYYPKVASVVLILSTILPPMFIKTDETI